MPRRALYYTKQANRINGIGLELDEEYYDKRLPQWKNDQSQEGCTSSNYDQYLDGLACEMEY